MALTDRRIRVNIFLLHKLTCIVHRSFVVLKHDGIILWIERQSLLQEPTIRCQMHKQSTHTNTLPSSAANVTIRDRRLLLTASASLSFVFCCFFAWAHYFLKLNINVSVSVYKSKDRWHPAILESYFMASENFETWEKEATLPFYFSFISDRNARKQLTSSPEYMRSWMSWG